VVLNFYDPYLEVYMRWFLLVFVVLIAILVSIPSAQSAEVVNSDGYVHADGFYVKNGVTHTRDIVWYKKWVWVNACYKGGCYVNGYWTYTWEYYYEYTPVKLPAASDPEWRIKLLAIAAARDKAEGKLRYYAQEQNHFLEAVNALGLHGNFRYEAYGRNPVAPTGYGNLQLSHAGINGNTIYGYSYSQVADAYGHTDLNALYQQSGFLTKNAQQLAGQANSEFNALIQQAGGNAARIAEILAKGKVGRDVIESIKGSPETRVETKVNGTVTVPNTVNASSDVVQSFLKLSGPATCVACHSGNKLEGGFDVSRIPTMEPQEIIEKVLPRLVDKNEKNRMPKGLPALTGEQVRQFIGGN